MANPAQSHSEPLTSTSQLVAAALMVGIAAEPGERNAEIIGLAERVDAQLVHSLDDFDPHYATPAAAATLCARGIDRVLTQAQAARVSVLCGACEVAAQGAGVVTE